MLFDLRGRRRRVVQATYLTLAVLLGGGLVLFGIGGDVSGGLIDAFKGEGGGGNVNSAIEERIDRLEKRVAANPGNQAALQELVRDYYQLAATQQESGTTEFPDDAKDELRKAASYWQRYLDAAEEPNPATATYALRVYDIGALNQPKQAQESASIVAQAENDSASYLQLVAYAALAGDTRTADLATQKAVDLAPNAEKKAVEQQAEQLKKQVRQQQPGR
jgi:hypothetical protein